jgi:hypothetical protein
MAILAEALWHEHRPMTRADVLVVPASIATPIVGLVWWRNR